MCHMGLMAPHVLMPAGLSAVLPVLLLSLFCDSLETKAAVCPQIRYPLTPGAVPVPPTSHWPEPPCRAPSTSP